MRRALVVVVVAAAACETEPIEELCTPRPTKAQPWCDAAPIAAARLEAGIAEVGTRIAMVGGIAQIEPGRVGITNEVIELNTLTGTWSALPAAPVAWTHGNVASSGGTLYLLGGLDGPAFAARGEAYALDAGGEAWRELAAMPIARGAAAVIAAPPTIYLLGGSISGGGATASCLAYDIRSGEWTALPDLPVARSHAAAMRRSDGTLIVAGGISALGLPLGDVWSLGPEPEPTWTMREPMPTRRGGCAHGVAVGQLVCAGGESGIDVLDVVESYDPINNEWRSWPVMPHPRAASQGAAVGQRLYVLGGAASHLLEPTDTVLVFSLLDALR